MIQLPDINHPIIDENGKVNKEWYIFFDSLVKIINAL